MQLALNLPLHPKQFTALQSEATEILYGGAAGGGKSHLMRTAAILWSVQIPGLQTYLFRRTFDELYKNHMEGPGSFPVLLAEWEKAKLVTINHGSHTIRFWNGSTIFLCHCQHEKNVYGYKGAEIHVLMPDELTQFTSTMYYFLRSRMRLGSLAVPPPLQGFFPRVVAGSNPGDIGHNWVKADFVDNAPEGQIKQMKKKDGGMRRQFIRAILEDNPTIDAEDYSGKLEGLADPALVRAMLLGDWNIVAGGMFDDLWKPSVHIVKPFKIPSSWQFDRAFDWGSSKPFSVGWWAESDGTTAPNGITYPRGTLFRVGEWYGWNGKPNEGCKMSNTEIAKGIKEREQENGWKVQPGPADSSIYDTDRGRSIADEMSDAGVQWTKADKTPGSRKNGWERMRVLLENAAKYPKEKPGLYVFDHCLQFLRTIPTLPRDKKKTDDVDTAAEDHTADETRYRVLNVSGVGVFL